MSDLDFNDDFDPDEAATFADIERKARREDPAPPNVVPALRVLLDGGVTDPAVIWAAMRPAEDVG